MTVQRRPASRRRQRIQAGCEGELLVAPIAAEDERAFPLKPAACRAPGDRVAREQIRTQLLGRRPGSRQEQDSGEAECVGQTMRSGRA
jgi:hypothetical protein